MVITLYLMGREVFTISTETHLDEQVTRSIGFAAAELADQYEDLDHGGLGHAKA